MKILLGILVLVTMLGCEKPEQQEKVHCVTNKNGHTACTNNKDRVFIPVDKWAPKKVVT